MPRRPFFGARRVAGLLLVCLTAWMVIAPSVEAASIRYVRPTDRDGEWEIEGRDFDFSEEVSLRLLGPSGQNHKFGTDTVNKRGRVNYKILIPRYFEPGQWTVYLRSRDKDDDAEETFELPYRPPNAALEVSQPGAPPGMTLTFTSAEFQPNEPVTYWVSGPGSEGLPGGTVLAESDGRVTFEFPVPADAQPGFWQMTAYGETSDRQGVAPFTVEG